LPWNGNKEGDTAKSLCEWLPARHECIELNGRAPAGFSHIDVWIRAEGDKDIRLLHHARRHISVEVEAGGDRNLGADDCAHTGDQLAFAVIDMLCDHRAMQIEKDAVKPARSPDAFYDLGRDLLECGFLDV